MEQESYKYGRVLNILRKSKPVPDSEDDINRDIMNRILQTGNSGFSFSDLIDFLFGWVYIGWVRRSLIAASVLLVMIFVYQQGIILKQINFLSRQMIINNGQAASDPADEIGKMLMMYKISGRKISAPVIKISEKQIKQLLESVNELQVKYEDLLNLIEGDPELKKYVEQKLIENNQIKINL